MPRSIQPSGDLQFFDTSPFALKADFLSSQAAQDTAIAAIQARPVAFTYDQQAEPSSPTAGQTWRERNASGLIIGEWTWNQASILWVRSVFLSFGGFSQTVSPVFIGSLNNPFASIIVLRAVGLVQCAAISSANLQINIAARGNPDPNGPNNSVIKTVASIGNINSVGIFIFDVSPAPVIISPHESRNGLGIEVIRTGTSSTVGSRFNFLVLEVRG